MKRYLSFWMLGIAVMLASCSQNEELLQGVDNNNSNSVTFSVALDEGMKTRAFADDPAVSSMNLRAILLEEPATEQGEPTSKEITAITSNGNGTFAVTVSGMMTNSKYKLVLWADNDNNYTVTNNVATPANASKPGIAFYGTSGEYQTPDELSVKAGETLELTHAVAKVTLNTTTALTDGKTATLSVPTRTSFNLISGEATGEGTASDTSEGVTSGNLCSVYVLCNDDDNLPTATITLSNGQEKVIASLPMKRNNHIKLQGDVDGIRTAGSLDFKVYLDKDWNEEDKVFLSAGVDAENHIITTEDAGQIAANTGWISEAIGDGKSFTITGPMNSDDLTAIANYLKDNSDTTIDLDLSDAELTAIPDDTFMGLYVESVFDERIKSLGEVSLPTTLTEIGENAFRYCPFFTVANWDELVSLTTIKSCAFRGSGLNGDITLPESITTIGDMAFYQTAITSIVFPSSITAIDVQMFYQSQNLKAVTFKGNVTSFDIRVFEGCSALKEIDLSACTAVPTYQDATVFEGFSDSEMGEITLKVKASLVESFKADAIWGKCNVTAAE